MKNIQPKRYINHEITIHQTYHYFWTHACL